MYSLSLLRFQVVCISGKVFPTLRSRVLTTAGPCRQLSSVGRKKQRNREKNAQFAMRSKALYDESSLPSFADLMRKIYLRSHPDLLRSSSPEKASVNDISMQSLNGILSVVKANTEFPSYNDRVIPFYVKIGGEFQLVELRLRTGGGDCRHQLAACFQEFFEKTEVNKGKFKWGKEYFQDFHLEDSNEKDNAA